MELEASNSLGPQSLPPTQKKQHLDDVAVSAQVSLCSAHRPCCVWHAGKGQILKLACDMVQKLDRIWVLYVAESAVRKRGRRCRDPVGRFRLCPNEASQSRPDNAMLYSALCCSRGAPSCSKVDQSDGCRWLWRVVWPMEPWRCTGNVLLSFVLLHRETEKKEPIFFCVHLF